jgi:hypothetical protein
MKISTYFLSFFIVCALVISPVMAQEKPADTMEIVREKMQADKKLLVAEAMGLTESEAKAFWPVYESYQKDLAKLNIRMAKVIDDYAANYGKLSNETAQKLLAEYLSIRGDHESLLKSYVPRFNEALPGNKVFRYYQIENKIRAAVDYELAINIPISP